MFGVEMSTLLPIAGIVIGILVILILIFSMWKKVPQDQAAVITGMKKRVITGGGGLVIPVLERVDYISLGTLSLNVMTNDSMSSQGVPVTVSATAVIKVRNSTEDILKAIERFTGKDERGVANVIQATADSVLKGKLREIVATMTVEDLYQRRDDFSTKVQEVIGTELNKMGLEVTTFTINDITDDNGYIKALGEGMIAERKKDAEIAKANAVKEVQVETSKAKKEGEEAKLLAETEIAKAEKEKQVKQAEFAAEQATAKAKADAAYTIQENITKKDVTDAEMDAELLRQNRNKEIAEAEIQVRIVAEQKNIELAQKQAEKKKADLQIEVIEPAEAEKNRQAKIADAEKYKEIAQAQAKAEAKRADAEAEAQAIRMKAQAEAEAIKASGIAEAEATRAKLEAEAEGIRAKGLAEAEAMEKKAEAYAKYNQAAVVEMLVSVMPEVAAQVAKPLASIDKVTVIDSGEGSGVAGISKNVPAVMAQVFETVKETTGIDMTEMVRANSYDAKTTRNVNVTGIPAADVDIITNTAEKAAQPAAANTTATAKK